LAANIKSLAQINKSRTRIKRPTSVNPATTVLRREKLSIKSVLSVAVILGLTCTQVQAGPKRQLNPQDEHRSLHHRDDMLSARRDIQASEQLRREEEAQSRDDGDPNKGWAYTVLSLRRSLGGDSTVYPNLYGLYASKAECEQARNARIASMESDPRDPNAPVRYPVQAWYSETRKRIEQSQTQAAGEVKGQTQTSVNGTSGTASGSGEVNSSTQTEYRRGGDAQALLFKHCVPYSYQQLRPLPKMKGPADPVRPGKPERRTENQQ
jgi:hypothetical protein